MIRSVIVEDEPDCRELLQLQLQQYCADVEVVGMAESVDEAVRLINALQPEIIFLDIEIDGGNSFEILQRIDYRKYNIIFATAYDHFALKAMKYSALDYILKPYNSDELVDAIRKFKLYRNVSYKDRDEGFRKLSAQKRNDFLLIPSIHGFKVYKIYNILWMSSDKSYTTFKIEDEMVVASKPIGYFEELLSAGRFYRIHNRTIVNLSHIKEYKKGKGGYVIMSDGEEFEVSNSRKDGLIRMLNT